MLNNDLVVIFIVEWNLGMSVKLDKTDLKIIEALSKNARQPVTQLAIEVGVSRPTLINRLKRLMMEDLIGINVGLNLEKLGFLTAVVFLEVKGGENQANLEKNLTKCPRVVYAFRLEGKANVMVILYGEDKRTLKAMIESLRDFSGVDIVSVMHSESPLSGETIQVHSNKADITPCERRCSECFRFKDGSCIGCPAVIEYKGML